MGATTIDLQQTLHGYRDGHELLTSSLSLDSATRRTMLALSDLSGDGHSRDFDVYLTGYPLQETGFYAFARTWYAHEMSRPGCVWTHTLLVPLDKLGQLEDLGGLREHFHRPELSQVPAVLPVIRHSIEPSSSRLVRFDGASYEIVVRLYGQDLPVLIFADSAAQYEETVVEIWNQQWNRLRATFGFCTGSLEPRTIGKRPLDLQVVPHQRQRRIQRAPEKFSIISTEDLLQSTKSAGAMRDLPVRPPSRAMQVPLTLFGAGQGPEHLFEVAASPEVEGRAQPLWRDVVVQDFAHRNEALHAFVEQYSVDIDPRRTAYRELIECWALLETLDGVATSIRDLTQRIATAFPRHSEAGALKQAVLGRESIARGATEADLVQELLTLPNSGAFDTAALDLPARAERLFRAGKHWRARAIAWLLTENSLNEAGREWARSVLENLSIEDLAGVFSENSELFARLLLERPTLARQEQLWRQPRELQRAAVRVLPAVRDDEALQQIITAIVSANATGLVDVLVRELGSRVIGKILVGIDRTHRARSDIDELHWSAQLRGHDTDVIDWLDCANEAEPRTLAFAVSLLGIYSNALSRASTSTFARHLRRTDVGAGDAWSTDYAAYCLAIALRNFNGDAGALAVRAFEPVHHAALSSAMSRRARQWLGPSLPRPGWFALDDWDDGEKVRRALVEAFLRHRWSPSLLADAVSDERTRLWIVRYCESFADGRELMRRAGL